MAETRATEARAIPIPPRRGLASRGWRAVARPSSLYAGLGALYVLVRVGSFTNVADRVTDTPSYEQVAAHPLWSLAFYTGVRPFTIPLFFKLVAGSEARIVTQLVISIAAWLVLAAVAARCVESRLVRPVAFVVVLGFSLTTEMILWDTLLLSESLTFALTALLLAAWLALVRSPTPLRAAAVLVVTAFWTFARDSNAYVVMVVALFAGVSLAWPGRRRLKLALLLGLAAVAALDVASADAGRRWLLPMHDIVFRRVIPTPSLRDYFVKRGLDLNGDWTSGPWLEHRSRDVYAGYLLSHPGYVLTAPFTGTQQALYSSPDNAESLLDPDLHIYDDNANLRFLTLPRPLERILFPRGIPVLIGLLCGVLLLAAAVAIRAGPRRTWLVPLGVLLSTYPHLLVVWHLSGYEVDRHAFEAAFLLRLALFLLLLFAVDRAATLWTGRDPRAKRLVGDTAS